jgi:uncharacterized membrane-anchored protein YhcB (DUF1043 family)
VPFKINNTTIIIVVAIIIGVIFAYLGHRIKVNEEQIEALKVKVDLCNADKASLTAQRAALIMAVEDQNKAIEELRVDYEKKLTKRKVVTKEILKVIYKDRNITIPSKECTDIANHIDSIREAGL